MRETVSISLTPSIKAELDAATKLEGLSRSDLVKKALVDYLFSTKFRALRAKMMTQAQVQGVFTDEDVFEQVS